MPVKTINDYTFYKIICLDDSVELCYVGSTANFNKRRQLHKSDCNNENRKKYNSKLYTTIRENGGWQNFKMIEMGKAEQLTKREAEQVEENYRQELRANLNSKRCYISLEEKQELDKEYQKKYKEENKDKIKERDKKYRQNNRDYYKEYNKQYREDNHDKLLEQAKQHYQDNQDKILERQKQYREDNRDKIKEKKGEKITCECGCELTRSTLFRHQKTKKHIDLMSIN
jgi:hypothetical protein